MLSPLQGRSRARRLRGLRVLLAHPFARRPFTRSRQSRGLRNPSGDGLRARSRTPERPCDRPGERDQRCVRSVSASLHSVNEHPYPVCFRLIVISSSLSVHSAGCRPPRPEIVRFTTHLSLRRIARAYRGGLLGLCRFLPAPRFSPVRFPGATTPCDRASDASVATLADTGARIFRGARETDSIETRQGCFHPARVNERSFPQPETPSIDKERAALAPPFRAAITHPDTPRCFLPRSPRAPSLIRAGRASRCHRTPMPGDRPFVTFGSFCHA